MRITIIIIKLFSVLLPFTLARSWTTNDACPDTIKTTVDGRSCKRAKGQHPWTSEPEFDTLDVVHTALSHCPNISSLDLCVPDGWCSLNEFFYFPFNPLGGDKYPNLTTLRLDGYDFDIPKYVRKEDSVTTWLRRISQAMIPKPTSTKSHLDLWLDAMSWSSIEELKIPKDDLTTEVFAKLPPQLTSLRKLDTSSVSFITALPHNTLTHLRVFGDVDTAKLDPIFKHHGSSLQSLQFRRPKASNEVFFDDFDVGVLPNIGRNLSHLAFNVPSYRTWPLDTLRIIASLPRLESADLYMNIQVASERQHQ